MLREKERTWEVYVEAGATMRLAHALFVKLIVEMDKILPRNEVDKLTRFEWNKLNHIQSDAEDQMYRDFHDKVEDGFGGDMTKVFYGGVGHEPHNEIDAQVIEKMKEIADGLFS